MYLTIPTLVDRMRARGIDADVDFLRSGAMAIDPPIYYSLALPFMAASLETLVSQGFRKDGQGTLLYSDTNLDRNSGYSLNANGVRQGTLGPGTTRAAHLADTNLVLGTGALTGHPQAGAWWLSRLTAILGPLEGSVFTVTPPTTVARLFTSNLVTLMTCRLVNPLVNPAEWRRNALLSLSPWIQRVAGDACAAVDAHSFVGERLSTSQEREWPRTVGGARVPPAVEDAFVDETVSRLRSLIRLGPNFDTSDLKNRGVGQASQAYAYRFAYEWAGWTPEGASARASAGEQASQGVERETNYPEPELSFAGSPLTSLSAWGRLRQYFNLERAKEVSSYGAIRTEPVRVR